MEDVAVIFGPILLLVPNDLLVMEIPNSVYSHSG